MTKATGSFWFDLVLSWNEPLLGNTDGFFVILQATGPDMAQTCDHILHAKWNKSIQPGSWSIWLTTDDRTAFSKLWKTPTKVHNESLFTNHLIGLTKNRLNSTESIIFSYLAETLKCYNNISSAIFHPLISWYQTDGVLLAIYL